MGVKNVELYNLLLEAKKLSDGRFQNSKLNNYEMIKGVVKLPLIETYDHIDQVLCCIDLLSGHFF